MTLFFLQKFAPEYEKAAGLVKNVNRVEAMETDSVSRREGITRFPTLRLYLNEGDESSELEYYNGLYGFNRETGKNVK